MADFDPFANQGGQVAWDPQHAADVKKQAEELSRRLAADTEDSGTGPALFSNGNDTDPDAPDSDDDVLPDGTA